MRSQSSGALTIALLSLTVHGLAACDANMVGGFEDGAGGSGGAGSAGATTAGTTTAGATTASDTTSGDATGTSTGTGGGTPPDYGSMAFIQSGNDTTLFGGFRRGRLDSCPVQLTVGACSLSRCDNVEPDDLGFDVDAGTVTVTGEGPPMTAAIDANGRYNAESDEPLWSATTQNLTLDASGSVVPAFTATVPTPPRISGLTTEPSDATTTSLGEDVELTWTHDGGAGIVVASFTRSNGVEASTVQCAFDPSDEAGTVPAELLAANSDLPTWGAFIRATAGVSVTAGTFEVALGAVDSIAGGLWKIACERRDGDPDADCAAEEFCDFQKPLCGTDGSVGECTSSLALTCPAELWVSEPPACGCDGQNYPNECDAKLNATSPWNGEGLCPPIQRCGGEDGLACDAGQFCDYPVHTCGEAGDGLGVCRDRPTSCPVVDEQHEVCGCSGTRYASPCDANLAGEDVGDDSC